MKKTPKFWILIFILIIFLFGLFSFYETMFREYHPIIGSQPKTEYSDFADGNKIESTTITATSSEENISFKLKDLLTFKLVIFNDPKNILPVPIISYLTSDGIIVTAISLSENCKSKDFYLDGKNIHCANCPSYWNKESLEAYACCSNYYPEPIESKLVGDEIRISYELLKNWKPRQ